MRVCSWSATARKVSLVVPSTGKTHLAVGLARAATQAGYCTSSPPLQTWPPAVRKPFSKADS
ncbi:hypothetical protein [Arthrobacter sp. Marseille-P9274]|uniref:hypothetical protein n=1 Tax=Arthrobacter sp. Marseille-P9274 TaxID=2866572 RepID=UPI0034D33AFE